MCNLCCIYNACVNEFLKCYPYDDVNNWLSWADADWTVVNWEFTESNLPKIKNKKKIKIK